MDVIIFYKTSTLAEYVHTTLMTIENLIPPEKDFKKKNPLTVSIKNKQTNKKPTTTTKQTNKIQNHYR